MAKQIVVCMDGTWNDPTQKTNVYKIFRMLPGKEQRVPAQGSIRTHLQKDAPDMHALYLEGVGAEGREREVLGGGLGVGLHERVIDAFVLISRLYEPGDKLSIFGFSRGAWSARALAGFIAGVGLLDKAAAAGTGAAGRADDLWKRLKRGECQGMGDRYWEGKDPCPIRLVGVWDTVGALGVPFFNGLRSVDALEARLFDFADLDLSPRVEFGRHAMAIDETRVDFIPTPWNARAGVVQLWFPGVHGDVGGGYLHTGLSDGALQWMAEEANALNAGLHLSSADPADAIHPDPLQDRHDEARKAAWALRPRKPREIPQDAILVPATMARLEGRADYRPPALRKVSSCAPFFVGATTPPPERLLPIREALPTRRLAIGQAASCVVFAQQWWNAAGIQVGRGERYRVSANMDEQWTDRKTPSDASGYASDSALLRLAEPTRRLESARWFALVAAIHPDVALESHNPRSGNFVTGSIESLARGVGKVDAESQIAALGGQGEILADRDGFLYFFANDSAFAYSNNAGYVDVVVTRDA